LANQFLIVFIFNSREKFGAQFFDRLGSIKREFVVHPTARKMTCLAFSFENRLNVVLETDFLIAN